MMSGIFRLPRTDSLISQELHQRQSALSKAFPQKGILIVVTAATPENAEQATSALEKELSQHSDLFHSVVQADSGELFQHTGMLFERKRGVEALEIVCAGSWEHR
jgi:uncharacterized protein